jgi:hypothetical protein
MHQCAPLLVQPKADGSAQLHQLRASHENPTCHTSCLVFYKNNNIGVKVKQVPSQAIPVSNIEAMYAMESMGRDRELGRLLELELPSLKEKLIRDYPQEQMVLEQQMVRRAQDYALQLHVSRQGVQEQMEIALNVSSSAFMLEYNGKHYSLITAKSICNLIYQLLSQIEPAHPLSPTRGHELTTKNQLST